MRGLPGSGKSTIAECFSNFSLFMPSAAPRLPAIVSADQFFMKKGKYKYAARLQGTAHKWCQSKFKAALKAGRSPVIVDNTNIKHSYMKPYMDSACKHGYAVVTMIVEDFDVAKLTKRNTHKVPKETIARMAKEFQR